jgi:mono/diheme cytochrome c family protein
VYSTLESVLNGGPAGWKWAEKSWGKIGLRRKIGFVLSITTISLAALLACDVEPRKSDAELGLNPQQASGRRVYDARCAECHYAYSKRDLRGPSLHGLFQKQFMGNGMPANDDRVGDIILMGRAKMPGFQQKINPQQFQDLMAYLHTL